MFDRVLNTSLVRVIILNLFQELVVNIRLDANITGNAKLEGWRFGVAIIFYYQYANIIDILLMAAFHVAMLIEQIAFCF